MRYSIWSPMIVLTLSALLVVGLAGCAGMVLLAKYIGAVSTISSFYDDLTDDHGYTLSGYVYLDPVDNTIAIRSTAALPGSNYQIYPDALVSIDSDPPRSKRTTKAGYFRFTAIQDTRVVLTVEDPDGRPVQFDVRLDSGQIDPRD